MKKIIPFLMAILLLAGCAAPKEEASYRQIGVDEAIAMMTKEQKNAILAKAYGARSQRQMRHIVSQIAGESIM